MSGIGTKMPARMGNQWPHITDPLTVTLLYVDDDPYAVVVYLQVNGDSTRWVVARDLLHEGIYAIHHPVGAGDLTVRVPRQNTQALSLMFRSTNGDDPQQPLYVLVPRQMVRRFLEETFKAVPMGEEDRFMNIDETIAFLLSEEA